MYSFEGNYKSKRIINLGKKKKETKELLLKKVVNDRKKRDDERRKQSAALLLQKIIRSRIAMKHAKESLRDDFDQDIFEYKSSLRRLIFFYQIEKDFYRLHDLVEIILMLSCRNISLLELLSNTSLWIVSRFGYILVKTINLTNNILFHKSIFMILPDLACLNVSLINLGYYKELHLYISRNDAIINSPDIQNFILAVIKPLKYFYIFEYSVQKIVLSKFVMGFFVLTKKYSDLMNFIMFQLESFFSKFVFLHVILDINFDCFSKEELLWILHNVLLYLVDLDNMKLKLSSLDEVDLYSQWVSEILICILKKTKVSVGTYCDLSFDDNDDVFEISVPRIVSEELFSKLNLFILFSTEHIAQIITYVFPSTVVNISKLFVVLMEFWPLKRSEIMTQLTIVSTSIDEFNDTNMLFILWEITKSYIKALKNNGNINLCEGSFFLRWNEQWYSMILLLELYSRILMTMVDDEFFDPIRNFIVFDDIEVLIKFLKEFSYVLYCRSQYLDTCFQSHNMSWFSIIRLRDIVTMLIQQLFIRNSRRPFFSHDYWLFNNRIDMTMFVSSVIAEFLKSDEKIDSSNQLISSYDDMLNSTEFYINVLRKFPFYIPFSIRIHILQSLINHDMEISGHLNSWDVVNRFSVTIRRDNIFEDGFTTLYSIGKDIKKPINIIFVDRYGLPEVGIDGGGITKEFLVSICKQALDTGFGLFCETHEHLLYPNPHSYACEPAQLQCFEFLGRLIGKCIYETILLDVTFAPFFLMKLLGKVSHLDDLFILDPELYKGLIFLKRYTGDVENDLFLNFTSIEEEFGKFVTVELIPGGSSVSVTKRNRLQYIYTLADYRLNKVISKQSNAFFKGLSEIIDIKWLSMFSCQELQNLIGGSSIPIDINDLRNNSVYGGFQDDDPTIELFWSVVHEFSDIERRLLLKFVTSVSRPPLLGFKDLRPLFCIRNGGDDINRLPTASTCVNLLMLPRYNDKTTMKSKLLYAVNFGAGFDLA
ncbi:hypothetical protein PMAC_000447 [Pneumocystis sp. 'macacae']|nr:hypothetical protein PMAC_000447 [Pneumocystis sp. 'macacae']